MYTLLHPEDISADMQHSPVLTVRISIRHIFMNLRHRKNLVCSSVLQIHKIVFTGLLR